MAIIKTINGITPVIGKNVYISETSVIVGEVVLGDECNVWFNAVLRGDVNSITIGNKVNIQDNAVVHCSYQKAATVIGNNVSIGHNAIVHGCTIEDNVLVGMGAIIMDHAYVHKNCIIAAGAVVLENSVLESNCIYAGVPAKKVKELSEEQLKDQVIRIADNYIKYASWFSE